MTQTEIVTIAACSMYPGMLKLREEEISRINSMDWPLREKVENISNLPPVYQQCIQVALMIYRTA